MTTEMPLAKDDNSFPLPLARELEHLFASEVCGNRADRIALEGKLPQVTASDDPAAPYAAAQLMHANHALWHLENLARRPGATDAELGSIKRLIDRWNPVRHAFIEAFDRAVARTFPWAVEADRLPKNSETPGSIVDRLSIQALKLHYLSGSSGLNDWRARPAAADPVLHYLWLMQQDLSTAFDSLLRQLQVGERGLRPYWACKSYGDPRANPRSGSLAGDQAVVPSQDSR